MRIGPGDGDQLALDFLNLTSVVLRPRVMSAGCGRHEQRARNPMTVEPQSAHRTTPRSRPESDGYYTQASSRRRDIQPNSADFELTWSKRAALDSFGD